MKRRVFVTLVVAVLGLTLVAACGTAGGPRDGGGGDPAPPAAPETPAERLFVLGSGGVEEVTGQGRVLVAGRQEGAFIFDTAVSPDGTDVALAVQPPPRQTPAGYDFGIDLYVGRDGGTPVAVALHERIAETMSRPVWLPGGNALLFAVLGRDETGAADIRIERIDLDTGVRQRFIEDALEPAISADGADLAYVTYDQQTGAEVIMIMDLATSASRPLLPADQRMANVANLAWSPDGGRLAFAAADPLTLLAPGGGVRAAVAHPTLRDMWLVNLDGSDLRRVTELADATLSLAWAADNRHVYAIGDTGFWRLDTLDGGQERLGEPELGGRVQTLVR